MSSRLMALFLFPFLVFTAQLFSQTAKNPQKPASTSVPLEEEVRRLKMAVELLQKQVAKNTLDLRTNETAHNSIFRRVLKLEPREEVEFDPSVKDFQRIDTSVGFLVVSIQDAQRFLDGYKLTLHVGNPTLASFNGLEVKAK